MTTIYKVSKKLWIDHSKEIDPAIERNGKTTRLDNLIKECGVNPLNNPDIETIRKEERERILEIINWHRATAKQEYEKGIERDGDRWVGSNCTDYPHGKVDALDSLKKELLKKVKK